MKIFLIIYCLVLIIYLILCIIDRKLNKRILDLEKKIKDKKEKHLFELLKEFDMTEEEFVQKLPFHMKKKLTESELMDLAISIAEGLLKKKKKEEIEEEKSKIDKMT